MTITSASAYCDRGLPKALNSLFVFHEYNRDSPTATASMLVRSLAMRFHGPILNEGESMVLELRPHWSVLAAPVASFVAAIAISITVIVVFPSAPFEIAYVLLALVAIALTWLVIRYVKRETTRFIVSSARILQSSGVLTRRGQEIPLDRLNDVSYRQGFLGRLIGVGDLVLVTGGEGDRMVFHKIWRPALTQQMIAGEIAHLRTRNLDRTAGKAPLSIPEQIEKLDELYRRGVLTQAEFEAKKTDLLGRM